jgi:hypothetical protein
MLRGVETEARRKRSFLIHLIGVPFAIGLARDATLRTKRSLSSQMKD